MLISDRVREAIGVFLVEGRYWRDNATSVENQLFWTDKVTAHELALDVLDMASDPHLGVSCHPDSDCEHDEPTLNMVLGRIPALTRFLVPMRTTKTELIQEVEESLLKFIGYEVEVYLHEQITNA